MIQWIRKAVKTILHGIKKGWNWLLSKITNIFSSSKNHNSNPEEQNQQKSRQEEVVVTLEQSHEPAAYSGNNPNPVEVGGTERLKQDQCIFYTISC
jgi:hypothetical protein